jgi:hypothetical protein
MSAKSRLHWVASGISCPQKYKKSRGLEEYHRLTEGATRISSAASSMPINKFNSYFSQSFVQMTASSTELIFMVMTRQFLIALTVSRQLHKIGRIFFLETEMMLILPIKTFSKSTSFSFWRSVSGFSQSGGLIEHLQTNINYNHGFLRVNYLWIFFKCTASHRGTT